MINDNIFWGLRGQWLWDDRTKEMHRYVLEAIDFPDEDGDTDKYGPAGQKPERTAPERLRYALDTYMDEYDATARRMLRASAKYKESGGLLRLAMGMAEWLKGLPSAVRVAFADADIEDLGRKWGLIDPENGHYTAGAFIENWWTIIAATLCVMARDRADIDMTPYYDTTNYYNQNKA